MKQILFLNFYAYLINEMKNHASRQEYRLAYKIELLFSPHKLLENF